MRHKRVQNRSKKHICGELFQVKTALKPRHKIRRYGLEDILNAHKLKNQIKANCQSKTGLYCAYPNSLHVLADERHILGIQKKGIFCKPRLIKENIETGKTSVFWHPPTRFVCSFFVNQKLDVVLTENGNRQLVCFSLKWGAIRRVWTNSAFERILSYAESRDYVYALGVNAVVQIRKDFKSFFIFLQPVNYGTDVCSSLLLKFKQRVYLFYLLRGKAFVNVLELKE